MGYVVPILDFIEDLTPLVITLTGVYLLDLVFTLDVYVLGIHTVGCGVGLGEVE